MAGNDDTHLDDMRRAGAALKILRKRAGVSQEEAAHQAGVHVQSWRNYEGGRRLMDNPTLAKITAAIGSSAEEHALEVVRLTGAPEPRSFATGMEERGRVLQLPVGGVAHGGAMRPSVFDQNSEPEILDFAAFFAPGTRVLRLAGMSMVPYAEPGGFVTYNPRQPARRGQGAVVELSDGSYLVKRFERIEADKLVVTELWPEEKLLEIDLGQVVGAYAIGLRGD